MVEKLRQEDLLRGEESGNLEDFLIVSVENNSAVNSSREKPRRPQPARKLLKSYRMFNLMQSLFSTYSQK